jgi:hypothetical protein
MGSGEVPGRLGAPIATNVYTNPYGMNMPCKNACTITNEGYTSCSDYQPIAPYASGHRWNHVVTVWRNFEPTQMYKVCMKQSPNRCLGVVGRSTAEGANIEQRTYDGTAAMQWQILQVESGKYKFVNVGSGKVIDTNGTQAVQRSFTAAAGQKIPIVYFADQPGWANLKPSSGTAGLSAYDASDGALIRLSTNLSPDWAKWGFTALGTVPTGTGGAGGSGGTFDSTRTYHLLPVHTTGKSLDVVNASQTNGTPVQQYMSEFNADSQAFYLLPSGSDWKITMNANQNKCLGGQAPALGALIVVQDCNGSANQAFTAVPDAMPGVFTFKSAANPSLCVEVQGALSSDGARMDLYTCAGIPNQKFMLQ